jgi:hypothetical protein
VQCSDSSLRGIWEVGYISPGTLHLEDRYTAICTEANHELNPMHMGLKFEEKGIGFEGSDGRLLVTNKGSLEFRSASAELRDCLSHSSLQVRSYSQHRSSL